jgi:hypothetical protein
MRWDSLLSHPGSCPADRVHLSIRSPTGWRSRLIPKYRTLDSFWVLTDPIVQFLSQQGPLIYSVASGLPYIRS